MEAPAESASRFEAVVLAGLALPFAAEVVAEVVERLSLSEAQQVALEQQELARGRRQKACRHHL